MHDLHGWTVARALGLLALLGGCGDGDGETTFGGNTMPGVSGASMTTTGASGETGATGQTGEPTTADATTGAASVSDGTTTAPDPTTGAMTTMTTMTSMTSMTTMTSDTTTSDDTTGAPSEFFMLSDPLIDGTVGAPVGGAFGPEGWTVTGNADRVYWEVPTLFEGSVAFTVKNITHDNLPLNDHEIFAMYEGGYDIEHPIKYSPDFRNNAYKSMIRIYGVAEGADRVGKQKIMWGMCPMGAPGYHGGSCPCVTPAGFFEEPFGGDQGWDGSPQRLKVEWKDGVTRYFRNDAEVLTIEWADSGLAFGPSSLYISLGNPRPLEVANASMPIGAVFYDLVIEGWTGPVSATCGV
jgi:hypothetical protein